MIIRIEELPQGQTIKDISINISFEDGQIKNIKTNNSEDFSRFGEIPRTSDEFTERFISPIKVGEVPNSVDNMPKISANNDKVFCSTDNSIAPLETSESISLVPDVTKIDLSKREHKVDTSMLDETF